MEKLYTAEDIANVLNIKIERVWTLARENDLPCVRLGKRQVRFNRQDVEQFIASGGSANGAAKQTEAQNDK
jgi:excisionase family DNA binding protein